MTHKSFSTFITAIIVLLIIMVPSMVFAGPGGGLDDDPGTPIDGGASLLAGAAVVYGFKKLKQRNRKH